MDDMKELAVNLVNQLYHEGVKPLIVEKENYAFIQDPIFDIKRNRVVAEVVKAVFRLELEPDKNLLEKLCRFLLLNQNTDGSWNEIHPYYNQPSALITSIVGEALLLRYADEPSPEVEDSLQRASRFVLSQEKSPGYFVKSTQKTADHLNVDATCAAFLALYGKQFSEETTMVTVRNTAQHIQTYQFPDGSFPYTANKGNYPYLYNIPCIHYQGVTLWYVSKIQELLNEEWLRDCIQKGVQWLSDVQLADGKFDWSKSGLMFSYYLSAAYAFAFSAFIFASRWDRKYLTNAQCCLDVLERNIDTLVLRWERDSWSTFPASMNSVLKTARLGQYPLKHRIFRLGYGLYRQTARRRFSHQMNENFFRQTSRLLKIEPSTIDPLHNYPDLFMTAEVLDCLSSYKLLLRGDLDII